MCPSSLEIDISSPIFLHFWQGDSRKSQDLAWAACSCQENRIKRQQTVSSAGCKVLAPNAGFLLDSLPSYCRFRPIECSYSQSVSVSVPQDKMRGSAIATRQGKRDAACFKHSIGFIFMSLRASTGRRARARAVRPGARRPPTVGGPAHALVWLLRGDSRATFVATQLNRGLQLGMAGRRTGDTRNFLGQARYTTKTTRMMCIRPRLVKTASSSSFGFQGPGSHLIGLVQQFWLSIGGCGGRQWGWKTMHLLPPRPQFFLRKWMWAN